MDTRANNPDPGIHLTLVQRPDGVRIEVGGEADIANVDILHRALSNMELDGTPLVVLHLADLTFADVAVLRELDSFVRAAQQTGHRVIVSQPNGTLWRVARSIGLLETVDDMS